ncbi:MAG TPA: T9SS type A sorting domain-containing protein [Candidatus Krumholzibacteria bacterium]|nr:T9SS type A sorting domain-containing protein [Candidatus Krumholzibacteria bacterium]
MQTRSWWMVCLAMFATAVPAHAQRWTNHIDASMINEIVLRNQTLYMATFGGLLLYDTATGTFEQYRNDNGLPTNSLTCLVFGSGNDIYTGTADIGVAKIRLQNGSVTLIRALSEQIDGLASNTINAVAVWGDQIVYGGTPGAGTIRNDFAAARYFQRDGLPGSDVVDVLPMGDQVFMATVDDTASVGGVAILDKVGNITKVPGTPSEPYVLGTDGTNVWVGTNTGIMRYDPAGGTWTDLGQAADVGLTSLRVRSLFWTGSEMWAGSGRTFMRYNGTGKSWTTHSADAIMLPYGLSNGQAGQDMKGLVVLPGGDVYVGAANAVDQRGPNLMRYDGTQLVNLRPRAPGANDVLRLAQDIDGSLWASFSRFYVGKLMPDGTWVNYNPTIPGAQWPTNQFANIAFLADSQGEKWFSTLSSSAGPFKPLDELDDQRDANYSNDVWTRHAEGSGGGDGYGSLRPIRAAEDPAGNRWFLSDIDMVDATPPQPNWQGINILSRDKTAWFQMNNTREPRMPRATVVDVAYGPSYTYVAFLTSGVYLWTHGGFDWANLTNYPSDGWSQFVEVGGEKYQLPAGADIRRIQLRSDGLMWIATKTGLFYTFGRKNDMHDILPYTGIGPGILPGSVQDILLDHDENLWVATDLGLNRIARNDFTDIQSFLTVASFIQLVNLRYPLDSIVPLANANCKSLAIDATRDILYVGTLGGISVYDFSPAPSKPTDLSRVYVYPNPVYTTKGHTGIKIGNLTGPVRVEVYNLEGQLVDSRSVKADSDVAWDLLTKDGYSASTGTYIVRIIGEHGSVQRSIALIR